MSSLVLTVAACGGGDDSDEGLTGDGLILGGPESCEDDPTCLSGLQDVYDVDLSEGFVAMASDNVAASLRGQAIDVGVMLATDPALTEGDLVILVDNQQMATGGETVFVVTQELADEHGLSTLSDLATLD